MAKMPEDRRAVFTDIYKLYEKYWDMPNTVEAWHDLAAEFGPMTEKHGNTPLVNRLLMAVYDAIDEENRSIMEAIRHG